MEQNTERSAAMKTFAIVGFVALIIFLVWLAVAIVSFLPSAFSSLASLADSIYNRQNTSELVVSTEANIVANGDTFTINWTNVKQPGTYTFSYVCDSGVSVDIRFPANQITAVPCGETIELGDSISSLEVMVQAERLRFTDVAYAISFIPRGNEAGEVTTSNVITIVNANIPQGVDRFAENTNVIEPETAETEVDTTAAPVATTPSVPTTKTVYTTTYSLPQSNPNGYVDLAITYIGVGYMNSNNVFVPTGTIDNDRRGAFQFEVKNIGTKTSGTWTFVADLTSGKTFSSKTQDALKPNERSIITIGFDEVGKTGTQQFGATVSTSNDTNSRNNSFSKTVKVVN